MNYSSQIGQDRFVAETLDFKRDGVFVDIGCAFPISISNTFSLEKELNWKGLCVDLENLEDPSGGNWTELRPNSVHLIHDALTLDYKKVFKQHKLPAIIDYLSVDLEPPELTLECLFKLPFDSYKFRCITFETDEYRPGGAGRRDVSREFLTRKGYRFIKNEGQQDDYYILNI